MPAILLIRPSKPMGSKPFMDSSFIARRAKIRIAAAWISRGAMARRIASTLRDADAQIASDFAAECDLRAKCLTRKFQRRKRCPFEYPCSTDLTCSAREICDDPASSVNDELKRPKPIASPVEVS